MKARRSDLITHKACCLPTALMLLAASASADVFVVTSNADFGPGTLRDAIDQANLNAGLDEIVFNEGLGTITVTGQMDITDSLRITGPAAGQVISGGGLTRIFAVTTEDTPLILENLVLTDGFTTAAGSSAHCVETDGKGAALCSRSLVDLRRVTVRNSRTTGDAAHGGGLFIRGGVIIEDSIIRNNRAETGGAVGGGGLYLESNPGSVIRNTLIEGNWSNSLGGGVFISSGMIELQDIAIVNNTAGLASAGLRARATRIANSTISGNQSPNSPVWFWPNAAGLQITNSTLTDNVASDPDTASNAGLVVSHASTDFQIDIDSVILAGNLAASDNFNVVPVAPDQVAEITVNVRHSLFGDDVAAINGQNLSNIFSDDPRLQPLAELGCALPAGAPGTEQCVPVHGFRAGSPAVNAGSNPDNLEFDQRGAGFPRVNDGQADIGAYESNDALFSDRFEMQP